MPDYGIARPAAGSGLLPWSWAVERLERSHDYWVATIHPDGRPNVTPVWGVWALIERINAKYGGGLTVDFLLGNATYRLRPSWAPGMVETDFTGSPTRWTFS
jgi:hypothetical protein